MNSMEQFQLFTERLMINLRLGLIPEDVCCLGISGELGELALLLTPMDITPQERRDKLCKELGDVFWYVTALAWHYDAKLVDLVQDAYKPYGHDSYILGLRAVSTLGAAVDHVKKVRWHGAEVDKGMVLASLRDGVGLLCAIAYRFGLSLNDVLDANVRKLRARHGDSFDGTAGDRSKPEAQ